MDEQEVDTFQTLAEIAERLCLSRDQRLALFIGTWTLDQLPPIETEQQYEAYAAEETRIRGEHWDGQKATLPQYSRSNPGIYAAALGARMIDWEMRVAGIGDE